jgi:hypothetical protein
MPNPLRATALLRHALHGTAACAPETASRIDLPAAPARRAVLFLAVRAARRSFIPA